MAELFLYLITGDRAGGAYGDTYIGYMGAVVAATSEQQAQRVHPGGGCQWDESGGRWVDANGAPGAFFDWVNPKHVRVQLLGVAGQDLKEGEVILADYSGD